MDENETPTPSAEVEQDAVELTEPNELDVYLDEVDKYQSDINAEFTALAVDCGSPEWATWCTQMDEWNAAIEAARTE